MVKHKEKKQQWHITKFIKHFADILSKYLSNSQSTVKKDIKTISKPEHVEPKSRDELLNFKLKKDLKHAFINKEFIVYYQPVFNCETQTIYGLEALIRWKHPKLGLILPEDFLPLATELNLMAPLGTWILKTSLSQFKTWTKEYPIRKPIKLIINISNEQLMEKDFIKNFNAILSKNNIKPEHLELDLKGNTIFNENLLPTLLALSAKGISLNVDDTGTGEFNWRYLKKIPIDTLKIDNPYTRVGQEKAKLLISGMIALAKELHLKMLVKNVENLKLLNFLMKKKCELIQGFYLGKPLNVSETTTLLKARS